MKKKIVILLCFIMVFMINIVAYADYTNVGVYGGGVPDKSQMISLAEQYYSFDSSKCENYIYMCWDNTAYLIPMYDYILVKNTLNVGSGLYSTNIYQYDDNNLILNNLGSDVPNAFKWKRDEEGTFSDSGHFTSFIFSEENDCWENSPNVFENDCMIFESTSNALLFYETGDYSYIKNVFDIIKEKIPSPKNVSAYLASEENALYIYYENDEYITNNELKTRLGVVYRYINASGDNVEIKTENIECEYLTRNQIKVDLSTLNEYDTGLVFCPLFNVEICGGQEVLGSPMSITYYLGEDTCRVATYDDNWTIEKYQDLLINDYSNKNDAYTGGTRVDFDSGIASAGQSDYGFLDNLFDGFGLLGNNGLIAYITNLFSFIPDEIKILLGAGVSAMIVIALFKLVVK